MRKDNAEKMVDALINAYLLMGQAERERLDDQFARETAENLRDIVIDGLTDKTAPVYRGAYGPQVVPTINQTDFPKPVITCEGDK